MNKDSSNLFVYGTLLKPIREVLNVLFPDAELVTEAYVFGKLFNVNNYPGLMIDNGDSKVLGELYRLPDNFLFKELDFYEEYNPADLQNSEFARIQTTVFNQADNSPFKAWVYVYNKDISGLEVINDGDYLKYRDKNRT